MRRWCLKLIGSFFSIQSNIFLQIAEDKASCIAVRVGAVADPQGLVAWVEEGEEKEVVMEVQEGEEIEMKEEKEENKELLALAVGVGMEMTSFLLKDCADVVR